MPDAPECLINTRDSTARILAVYGAAVALLVARRIDRGYGPPNDEQMAGIVEEAQSIAQFAEECVGHA
ncbi:MAG: hypothetical protein V1755_14075 [Chloroflexota bacterium]